MAVAGVNTASCHYAAWYIVSLLLDRSEAHTRNPDAIEADEQCLQLLTSRLPFGSPPTMSRLPVLNPD